MRKRNISKHKMTEERKLLLYLLPSLLGMLIFFIAPFAVSIYSAVIDNPVTANFVGLKNFRDVLFSSAFHQAIGNTLIFLTTSIPLNLIFPLILALLLNTTTKKKFFALIFLLPLVIPSGSIVFFWKNIFGINGLINGLFYRDNPINWIDTPASRLIVMFIFIWKSIGFNMVLFSAGLNFIPVEYYETASIEGAGVWRKFTNITLLYLTPTIFMTFLMSFINSFKTFKEIYMLYGSYPNSYIYMLQHYMQNQFTSVNYQRMAASAYILAVGFVIIVAVFYHFQRKISEKF